MKDLTDALWAAYRRNGDTRARHQLLDQYLGLVHHSAHQLARRISRDVEVEDLIGAGTVGLVQALEGFDPERGLAFSTYAMPRIRGAMLDELRQRDWMPRTIRMRNRQIAEARHAVQQRQGRMANPEELAEALGVDMGTFWRWQGESEGRAFVALDGSHDGGEGDETRLSETIADDSAVEPGDALTERETREVLLRAFRQLPEKDRLVLSLSYYEQMNLREIGEVLHVSESRVSQLRTRALKRLRGCVDAIEEAA